MKYKYRSVFVAPPGKTFLACDLSQAESWIVAYKANESKMKESLNKGLIHDLTASVLFGYESVERFMEIKKENPEIYTTQRYLGKRDNHGLAYRMGYKTQAESINKDSDKPPYVTISLAESKRQYELWHSFYSIKDWWNDIDRQLWDTRRLRTVYGFERTFFGDPRDSATQREATAFEPQSTVAQHFYGKLQPGNEIPGGLLEIYRQLVMPFKDILIVNTAHDSLCLEVPEKNYKDIAEQVVKLLRRPIVINGDDFIIPVDAEVGTRFGEMRKYKI